MKRIAFIVQLPKGISPGQRFRFEAWEPTLEKAGFSIDTFPFWNAAGRQILYQKGHHLQKLMHLVLGYLRRVMLLFSLRKYDWIYLQREAAPLGPPVFEWVMAKVLRLRIVYDYDDAIWIPTPGSALVKWLKASWKVGRICAWSYKIVGGNEYLCDYARRHSKAPVICIPTVVNTETQYNRLKQHTAKDTVVIGWTGSHSTLVYLDQIVPVLQKLALRCNFKFLVIADRIPELSIQNLTFCKWNASTEIDDLLRIDIGIMPLSQDAWSEGKCGFKLIQYLALGIPAVATQVGVNDKIVLEGETGYLCNTEAEWETALSRLIEDADLRAQLGLSGRRHIEDHFSIASQESAFLNLFRADN